MIDMYVHNNDSDDLSKSELLKELIDSMVIKS